MKTTTARTADLAVDDTLDTETLETDALTTDARNADAYAGGGLDEDTLDDETAWTAVLARDRSYDGRFVYAVRTTGVYCRPSCPSRRPNRENVAFHHTTRDAEVAGFRPCKRCHPQYRGGTAADASVRAAVRYLEEHLDDAVTLEALAEAVGMSPFHLQRTFKKRVGVSPKAYQKARRVGRMKSALREHDSVLGAIYDTGFSSVSGAYELAAAGLGMTPSAYRDGAAGVTIRFATSETPFGRMLVAATERGVCAVSLGDGDEELVHGLREEFPGAEIEPDAEHIGPWAEEIVAGLRGHHPGLALPLELHGTAFQVRVWNALQQIPVGETRSYKEVAEAIGAPRAARAVASACAANRAALVVPCHRVVRGTGGAGGYRWGAERKARILDLEKSSG